MVRYRRASVMEVMAADGEGEEGELAQAVAAFAEDEAAAEEAARYPPLRTILTICFVW